MQRELLAEWEAAGEEGGYVYEEMGECILAQQKPEEAKPWFARAWNVLSKDPWLKDGEPDRLERMAKLGGIKP